MTALRMAAPSRVSKSVTARSEPVLASKEVSAGLNRTQEMESQPQEKEWMGLERAWSQTKTRLSAAVAKRASRQWWSMEVRLSLWSQVLSAVGS